MVLIQTGPALTIEEGQALASLMRDPNWPVYQNYLGRVEKEADIRLMRLNKGLEENGYWKGIRQLARDLINLPEDIVKQLFAKEEEER